MVALDFHHFVAVRNDENGLAINCGHKSHTWESLSLRKAGSSAISRAVGMGVSHCVLNMNRVIGVYEIKAGTVVASSVAPKTATWADDLLQEISF